MRLVKYPEEILSKELKEVDIENPGFDPVALKKEMTEFMVECGGVGLSACQVGMDAKLFVMGTSLNNSTLCINPTVLQFTKETVSDVEGCLSFPNMFVDVKRPNEILAEYYDENLVKQTIKITGYSAKCYLHELDHVLGITMKDRVSNLRWNQARKRAKKTSKKLP
jgi:peptide deformylase